MIELIDEKPIITCSTGSGANCAISVLRLSGFKSIDHFNKYFSTKTIKPRYNHFAKLIDESGKLLDEVVFSFYPGPNSYTGENVLEVSVHGNQLNVHRITEFFKTLGFRDARPGEFTFRALQNNKMSLSQVEGLDLLLNSSSAIAFSQGLDLLNGELHKSYLALYESLLKMKAHLELMIDFSDDIGDEEGMRLFKNSVEVFRKEIMGLYSRSKTEHSSLLKPKVVLLGETNAGKSTFFNKLLNFNRSIVSSVAGTTRDYVSEPIQIGDNLYSLYDTAGIRSTFDLIEEEGIHRAMKLIDEAFFKILLVNPFQTDMKNFEKVLQYEHDVVIFSHADFSDFHREIEKFSRLNLRAKNFFKYSATENIFAEFKLGPIEPATQKSGPIGPISKNDGPIEPVSKNSGPIEPVSKNSGPIEPVSKNSGPIEPVLKNSGPIEPVVVVTALIDEKFKTLTSANPIFIGRHRETIKNIYTKFSEFSYNINDISDIAIISSEINMLDASTKELIGYIAPESVLNSIFDNFCIGK